MWGTGSGQISKIAAVVQLFTVVEIIISTDGDDYLTTLTFRENIIVF